jgi:hypothetical protein
VKLQDQVLELDRSDFELVSSIKKLVVLSADGKGNS